MSVRFGGVRLGVCAALFAALLGAGAHAAEREVTIPGGGALTLHATLQTAEHPHGGAAVLILAGSGPTDRNGDSTVAGVRPGTYRMLAQGLAEVGVTSLRPDKRLIGASKAAGVTEQGVTLDTFVDDAVGWGRFLAAQPGVRCVVVFGHSEGALVGALAANRIPACGLVSAAGEGRPLGDVVIAQFKSAGMSGELLKESTDAVRTLEQGHTVTDYPPQLRGLFRPSVQPFLISLLRTDPTAAIAKVKAPVLILQGDHDIQIGVEDARLLAAAHPGAALTIVPGMNHILKDGPTDRAANVATYRDPTLPLDPAVVPAVVAFAKHAGG